jgi:hypothetical protein
MILCVVCGALTACASVSMPMVGMLSDVYANRWGEGVNAEVPQRLNPSFRYLKVDVTGRPSAFLVLGYIEPDSLGDIEVWYSANREVLKTQNGRLIGTAGLEIDWRHVSYPQPPADWAWVLEKSAGQTQHERVRDVMPGYRMGIREQVLTRVTVPPAQVIPESLPPGVIWVEEQVMAAGPTSLPSAWFGVASVDGRSEVIASFQCLSATLCLRLQPWPVVVSTK